MIITRVEAENFASYKHLEFNFDAKGLVLLHGATGSGKSTLCDVTPWVLFGRTAKNGAADDVLSWNSNNATRATVFLSLPQGAYSITRVRSKGSKANDLYFQAEGSYEAVRGKDVTDTQKLINTLLGIDCDLYLSGAYYHEFSQTASFFTSAAKIRRTITEQIVDLSLPKRVHTNLVEERKARRSSLAELRQALIADGRYLNHLVKREEVAARDFHIQIEKEIAGITEESKPYAEQSAHLVELQSTLASLKATDTCAHCGNVKNNRAYERAMSNLNQAQSAQRMLIACHSRIKALKLKEAPPSAAGEIEDLRAANVVLTDAVREEEYYIASLTELEDVVQTYRGVAIKNTISMIETSTNEFLSKFYDAEISISLSTEDADKIDIDIYKDGNQCAIGQLSKGQRTLLKFCFGVSVMKAVSYHQGVAFKQLFFDESLDGLDDALKLKTLNMLWTLTQEYDTIVLVEHNSSIRAQVETQYEVRLVGGHSEIQ